MGRIALLACLQLASLFAAAAAAAAPEPEPSAGNGPLVQLLGRFYPGGGDGIATLPQWATWAGSAATVSFHLSSSVTVVIDASVSAWPPGDDWNLQTASTIPNAVFQFELDGKVVGTGQITNETQTLTWSQARLSTGLHTLTITKLSEARYGSAWLKSISLSRGGRFLPPPDTTGQLSGRRMLFVGDSITNGCGNTGDASCGATNSTVQNALLAFGPVAARRFQADFQLVAWSGATVGIYHQRANKTWAEEVQRLYQPRLRDLFPKADAQSPGSAPEYNTSAFVPQVVVIAGGINDFGNAGLSPEFKVTSDSLGPLPSMQEWLGEYEALVRQVRAAYPQAPVVIMAWPFEMVLSGLCDWQCNTVYQGWMAAVGARLDAAGIQDTYFLQLDGSAFDTSNYCRYHPDVATHAQIASQLVEFIEKAVLPDWADAGPSPAAVPPPSGEGPGAAAVSPAPGR